MSDTHYFAGFVRRAGALFIDSLLISLPGAYAHLAGLTTGSVWGDVALESLVWLPYYVLFTASTWQATPGKRVFGIKVTDLEGRRIGIGRSTARYLASWISALVFFIGYLMVPFTRRRQALHDMMAGTLVVNRDLQPGTLPADARVMPLTGSMASATVAALFAFLTFTWVTGFVITPDDAAVGVGEPAGSPGGPSYRLAYELYEVPLFHGKPRLIKEGAREYRLADVRVRPGPDGTPDSAVKRLEVVDGFALEANIHREPVIQGFGLDLDKGFGFSWEWFDLESGYVFRKRQGPGRLQVRLHTAEGKEEIAEILFLDDVTFRLDRYLMIPFTGDATEQLVVKKGSVLRLMAL